MKGRNLIRHERICYTYSTQRKRVKNNILLKLSNYEIAKDIIKREIYSKFKFIKQLLNFPLLFGRDHNFRKLVNYFYILITLISEIKKLKE